MALRSTYSTGVFNSGLYGVPETTQFSASASVGVSATVGSVTVVSASASASISSSATASGQILKDGSTTASVLSFVTAAAVEYPVVPGFRPGYGLNTYGSYVYGENYSVEEGSATAPITVSTTATPQVTRNVSASASIQTAFTSNGVIDVVGRATATVSLTPEIVYNRVRLCSASLQILGDATVSARYKWLPAADPTTTWTTADYLERAA